MPPRFRPPGFHDAGFTHCKLMFRSSRREANGMGWATDYPYAAINLLTRVGELTKTTISRDGDREPNYWVVRATDPALFECPFLMGTDVGTAYFSPEEAAKLRDYFLKGGFLWVDDFWGTRAWDQWAGAFWGGLSGFTSTLAHAGGPPFAVYMLAQKVDKTLFVGTSAVFFLVVNYVKLVPYYFVGQLNVGNLAAALLFSPLAPLGIWLGVWIHRRMSQTVFLNVSYTLLLATGLKLIYDAVA